MEAGDEVSLAVGPGWDDMSLRLWGLLDGRHSNEDWLRCHVKNHHAAWLEACFLGRSGHSLWLLARPPS